MINKYDWQAIVLQYRMEHPGDDTPEDVIIRNFFEQEHLSANKAKPSILKRFRVWYDNFCLRWYEAP